MADLIAIGYEYEDDAAQAERDLEQWADDLQIEPDAVAVIVRDGDGRYKVQTNHHLVGSGSTWGMLWGPLFGLLFFVPVFGMAVGAGLGDLMGKLQRIGIDTEFQERVRDCLQPGTSTLFVVVENGSSDRLLRALDSHGGMASVTLLSSAAQSEIQEHMHGDPAPA